MKTPNNMISHIEKIFKGEYDIPYEKENPVILDIGGNVGGFCLWANQRWKNSKIYSYEPIKNNFEFLKLNTKDLDNIMVMNLAIGSKTEQRRMYYGAHNVGECSFQQGAEQVEEGEDVSVVAASLLPKADIVKIDTEGAEIEILENMVIKPDVYLIEYHSAYNRRRIDNILHDYTLIAADIAHPNYGIVKYFLSSKIKYE
jgi:FkbM family methyltransferase